MMDTEQVYYDSKTQNFYILRSPDAPVSSTWKSVSHQHNLRSSDKTLVVNMKGKKKVVVKSRK